MSDSFNKENLVKDIKDWIQLDDEISKYRRMIKELNMQKKNTTINLVKTMKEKSIDCFEISSGTLVYKQTKSKKAITSKLLFDTLKNIYKNDEQVESIIKQIQDNRPEVIKESITRKKT